VHSKSYRQAMTVTTEALRELVDSDDAADLPPLSSVLVRCLELPAELPADLTIGEVSEITGVSAHTLRCRVGGGRRRVICYLRPPYRTARAVFPQAALNGCSPSGGSSHAYWESVAEDSPGHTHRRGGFPGAYAIRHSPIV
jgi:hypothetical protein